MRVPAPLIGLGLLLAGCSGAAPSAPETSTSAPAEAFTPPVEVPSGMSIDLLRPLSGLQECTLQPEAIGVVVEGLHLPDDAVVTEVDDQGPLVEFRGYIPLTPVQLRAWFQTQPELEVLQIEDEIREAEALVTDGAHRQFAKAQAVCEQGSIFIGVVAPEVEADAVPTPTGAP